MSTNKDFFGGASLAVCLKDDQPVSEKTGESVTAKSPPKPSETSSTSQEPNGQGDTVRPKPTPVEPSTTGDASVSPKSAASQLAKAKQAGGVIRGGESVPESQDGAKDEEDRNRSQDGPEPVSMSRNVDTNTEARDNQEQGGMNVARTPQVTTSGGANESSEEARVFSVITDSQLSWNGGTLNDTPLTNSPIRPQHRDAVNTHGEAAGTRESSWKLDADFSLRSPSVLRTGDKQTVVIDGKNEQFIFTRKEPKVGAGGEAEFELEVKRTSTSGVLFIILKLLYLYVTVFFGGFWMVCSVFLILQFVMGVVVTAFTADPVNTVQAVLAALSIFSFILLIFMLAHFLTLVVGFVRDGWEGFDFLLSWKLPIAKALTNEWMIRIWLLLLPCIALGISLFARSEDPWLWPLVIALIFTMLLFLFYVIVTMRIEFQLCMDLMRGHRSISQGIPPEEESNENAQCLDRDVLKELIVLRKRDLFALTSSHVKAETCSFMWCEGKCCTSYGCCRCCIAIGCYEETQEGVETEALYRFEDFGKPRPVLDGDGATVMNTCCMRNKPIVTPRQRRDQQDVNVMFVIMGLFIAGVFFVPLAYIDWLSFFEKTALFIAVAVYIVLFIVVCSFCLRNYEDATAQPEEDNENSAEDGNNRPRVTDDRSIYDGTRSRFVVDARVNYGSAWTWVLIVVFVILLFIVPTVRFAFQEMWGLMVFYYLLWILLFYRFLFNARAIVESLGPESLRVLRERQRESTCNERQMYLLLTRMLKPETSIFTAGFIFLAVGALRTDSESSNSLDPIGLYANDTFDSRQYVAPPGHIWLQYPACDMAKFSSLKMFGANASVPTLLDLAFLSALTYKDESIVQSSLDAWFGVGGATLKSLPKTEFPTRAEFRLIYIEEYGLDVVTVRGTVTTVDALMDAQLWIGALGLQILRSLLPLGFLWNPVLPYLDYGMELLTPQNVLNYFTEVQLFVQEVRKAGATNLLLTGHSLGGGISMLVGAAERLPGIAMSGPNGGITYLKHGIERQALDEYTLNIIPEYDIFPMVDDPALLVQNILCSASRTEGILACHASLRTACEIMLACGSGVRPPLNCSTNENIIVERRQFGT